MFNLDQEIRQKTTYFKNVRLRYRKIYDNDGYDSRFEMICGNGLHKFFDNKNILIQKQKKYPNSDFICDFYIEINDKKMWIEVSNYNLKENPSYYKKIKFKEKIILEIGDEFYFINNLFQLNSFISKIKGMFFKKNI